MQAEADVTLRSGLLVAAMPLQLCDVDFRDGHAIAQLSMDAFYDDAMQQSLFPGMSKVKRIEGLVDRWPRNHGSSTKHYKKVVDTETGKTVSYSCWSFRHTDAARQVKSVSGM